ncbi:sugar phosphate nucleotidyltransferase [Pelagicoccus sp. SDUM812003]|uniref:nucleotidyltransferase family protein n=1 Tax=Pelagicoccus sp. SDUM812003 TaxID=3041267 RepID=UPI00280E5EFA|nr:sugar phosphate nucleotidyltransferase [Pelagicoccus sp. SDUM812003]MDQ8205178.1 NTP transferase domain-containing protein [Pelagicoccus sp. SDUM812003]
MKPTLLVLAAGMGSRFGGLKQMEPVGPKGEWILDYSVRDAAAAGFEKVVFVIRKEMETEFRALTEAKYRDQLQIAYAFQETTDTPIEVPHGGQRSKPWGTGHAVYAAREHLDAPFAVINADDFYGAAAFRELAHFLSDAANQSAGETYALVGYQLSNTLSEHGSVSRGVCATNENAELVSIEEHTDIAAASATEIRAKNARGETVTLPPDTLVSLNCWGFPAGWAKKLEQLFADFLKARGSEAKSEFYLPAAVDSLIKTGQARAVVLPCSARWLGVTHREDLPAVRAAIAEITSQ